jgi:3-hydroxyisobutyrate dehydrogenase
MTEQTGKSQITFIWVDTSTTDYHNTLRIAEEAKEKGVLSLESPVSNLSHMGADFGNTSIYVGGDKKAYDNIKEEYSQFRNEIF